MAQVGTLADALDALGAGGLVVFPTETLWSLSARADDVEAIRRVLEAKGRPDRVPLAVGFPDWATARQAVDVTPGADALAAKYLPGPLSLVLKRRDERFAPCAPRLDTLSIRIPDHDLAQAILRRAGPLVMTSANQHGQADPITTAQVMQALRGVDAVILDGEIGGIASTVVDATGDAPVVLREGVIPTSEVHAAWP